MRLAGIESIVRSTNFHERVTDGVHVWQETKKQQAAIEESARTAAV
jgi:hypothetical protein